MKYLKEKRGELKVSKGKIQSDLKSKREMLDSAQNSFVAKVQTDLINSDPKNICVKFQMDTLSPIG